MRLTFLGHACHLVEVGGARILTDPWLCDPIFGGHVERDPPLGFGIADLPAVIAMVHRALALDESFDGGAVHELMISLENLPANMGGSLERAKAHYERAVELSGGQKAGTYVTWAESAVVRTQDRGEFERLLHRALGIDPDDEPRLRLQNLIAQKRARHLLARVEDLFLDFDTEEEERSMP